VLANLRILLDLSRSGVSVEEIQKTGIEMINSITESEGALLAYV
jgi:hypothetical protein